MKLIVVVLLFGASFATHAAKGVKWGVGVTAFTAGVSDPDGNTGTSDLSTSLSAVSIIDSGRDNRWFSMVEIGSYDLDATTSEIGQSNDFYYIGTTYQTNFRWSRNLKPWFGVGLALGSETVTNRHTVDTDGFLSQAFEDRDELGVLLVLDATHDFQIYKQDFMIRASYLASLYDGSDTLGISINWLFF